MLSGEIRKLEQENQRLQAALKTMQVKLKAEERKPRACEYCKYYLQHYVNVDGNYKPTYCGHCVHGRVKKRMKDESCQYFEFGTYSIRNYV